MSKSIKKKNPRDFGLYKITFFCEETLFREATIDRLQPADRGQCRRFEEYFKAHIRRQVLPLSGFPGPGDEGRQKPDEP